MTRKLLVAVLMIFSVIFIGCGGKRVKVNPNDPVWKYKQVFLEQYGFFVTKKEVVSYYKDVLGVVGRENEILNNLTTIADVDKFTEIFFKVRDPNPNTPENEFKDTIDQRIQDIKNEIFASDLDIPLTRFDHNGGLRGDLAHVYLFYGAPQPRNKAKLSQGNTHGELMVWYYFDFQGAPLFRFLFYEKYGKVSLFKRHVNIFRLEDLFDPLMSPLKEISNRPVSTPEDLYDVWLELEREDPEWIFRGALLQFSYYSDVVIEGGDNKRLGALDPPEPAAMVGARFKPTVLGQPGDLTGREFLSNSYNSFIPAELTIAKNSRPSFTINAGYSSVDWEIRDKNAEAILDLRISFQNKTTKNIKEFSVRFTITKPRVEVEIKRRNFVMMSIPLDGIQNFARPEEPRETLRQLIDKLESDVYVVNVDLRQAVTKKSTGGWREEVVIK